MRASRRVSYSAATDCRIDSCASPSPPKPTALPSCNHQPAWNSSFPGPMETSPQSFDGSAVARLTSQVGSAGEEIGRPPRNGRRRSRRLGTAAAQDVRAIRGYLASAPNMVSRMSTQPCISVAALGPPQTMHGGWKPPLHDTDRIALSRQSCVPTERSV